MNDLIEFQYMEDMSPTSKRFMRNDVLFNFRSL